MFPAGAGRTDTPTPLKRSASGTASPARIRWIVNICVRGYLTLEHVQIPASAISRGKVLHLTDDAEAVR